MLPDKVHSGQVIDTTGDATATAAGNTQTTIKKKNNADFKLTEPPETSPSQPDCKKITGKIFSLRKT